MKTEVAQMSADNLLGHFRRLVQEERRLTQEVLETINEVDRRQLHVERGFSSLIEWLVQDFGYSHSAAFRRIQAARLLRVIPAVADKIQAGEVNLTTLAQVQTAIRREEKRTGARVSAIQKQKLLQKIEGKSSQETERVLLKEMPEAVPQKDLVKQVSPEQVRLSVTLTEAQMRKLGRAKEILSHAQFNADWAEIIERLAEFYLKHKDPLLKKEKSEGRVGRNESTLRARSQKMAIRVDGENIPPADPKTVMQGAAVVESLIHRQQQAGVSAALRRVVLKRDQGRCTYRHPQTGRICGSRYQVEVDHIQPRALNGGSSTRNLRCLCRVHNQWRARQTFGASAEKRARVD